MTDKKTEALKLAQKAMGLIGADLVCEAAHHEKKDRHQIGEPCPIQARWHQAFAAIHEALAEQPAPPPECKTDSEKTAFAFGWWKALEENRKQPAQQQDDTDWDHVWLLIKAANYASSRGLITGTSNWGAAVSRYMRNEAPKQEQPPQPSKPWVSLTDEDKQIAFDDTQEGGGFWEFADAIEAKLKAKNT